MCFYISYIISLLIFISCILLLVVLNKYINTCFTLFYCVILTSIHTCCLFGHRLEPSLSHQIINVFEYCIRLNYNILLHTYICTFSLCHCLPLSVWILSKFQNDKPMVDIKKKKKSACIFSPQRYFLRFIISCSSCFLCT